MTRKRLIIIGAGPKAMAIAAKNSILHTLGFKTPEIHIIEKGSVGAYWTGKEGYTNGEQLLGTFPEKDIGFPYRSRSWNPYNREVDTRMRGYSWQQFLIEEGEYSDWVDRGRPSPTHLKWALYLQWIAHRFGERVCLHKGEVHEIDLDEDRWRVRFGSQSLEGDGLVLTGPGKVRLPGPLPNDDRILTVESYWKIYQRFPELTRQRIAIVGTGESAAAIALDLAGQHSITIISPNGMTYSRGESYHENRMFSDPEATHWQNLSFSDRKQFIYRTDRGVFSSRAMALFNDRRDVEILPGRFSTVRIGKEKGLEVEFFYETGSQFRPFDYVILATGGDSVSLLREVLNGKTKERLSSKLNVQTLTQDTLESKIDSHLSVQPLRPRLFLPMLAAATQGPGFSNLSCLGTLSDRILEPFVKDD